MNGCGLRIAQQSVARFVARARHQSVDGHQHRAVVGPQCEHVGADVGAGENFVERTEGGHRLAPFPGPAPTPGSKTASENRAACGRTLTYECATSPGTQPRHRLRE